MKFLATTFILSILISLPASAKSAQYYRVWQGFKKADLTEQKFLSELPQFMEDTVDLYRGRALNQYLVAIPPKDKPSFIPDEFALVALYNESIYREIRNTDEGRHYGARHWDIFNRQSSGSTHFHNYNQEDIQELINNHAYDMLGKPVDWTKGVSTFYLGLRRENISQTTFLEKLKNHIELATNSFKNYGLDGYIVIANENYEVAFMHWRSSEHMQMAFNSELGQKVFKDAEGILKNLMFKKPIVYSGELVEKNSFIKTVY